MPWLNYSGRTAAEFPLAVSGGGSVSPHLLQSRSAWDEILKTLAPAIKDYLQQKKADEVANQLMNMENPPRAEAVDPSIQGAPATQPFTGGQQAYKAQKLYQDYLRQQAGDQAQSTNEYWQNKVREAQFNKLQAEADASDGDGRGLTPYQREQTRLREMDIMRKREKDEGSKPPGVPWSVYNASRTQNFDPAQAFRDWQQQQSSTEGPTAPASDKYVVGKKYRDKNGNVATYLGNGQWSQ